MGKGKKGKRGKKRAKRTKKAEAMVRDVLASGPATLKGPENVNVLQTGTFRSREEELRLRRRRTILG